MKATLYRNIVILVYVLLLPLVGFAQRAGDLDRSFNYGRGENYGFNEGTGANGAVRASVIQPDGKIVIGGDFTSYNGISRNRIARLNSDGTLDVSFNPGNGVNNAVYALVLQNDGRLIIGGDFNTYNSITRNNIARLNVNGSLDTSFNPGAGSNGQILTITIQSDDKVIIGGRFLTYNGISRNRIARLNLNGSLDTSFNPGIGANNYVFSTTLQANGKIIIGGYFTSFNGIVRNSIARINTNGSLDTTFNPGIGANNSIYAIALQTNGKVIIGGQFTSYNGTARNSIAKLNADGSLDTTFNPGSGLQYRFWPGPIVNCISLLANDKIIIGGCFETYAGTARNGIAQLNTNGSLDLSFDIGIGNLFGVSTIIIDSNEKILVGGGFSRYNLTSRNYLVLLNIDGALELEFNKSVGVGGVVNTLKILSNSKILIGGNFISYNDYHRNNLAVLNEDGSLDTSLNFGLGTNGMVNCITIQTNGKILIGGNFTSYNGIESYGIARLNIDGSYDTSFNLGLGVNGIVNCIIVQPDGKILIGGTFTDHNGFSRNGISRLNSNGSIDLNYRTLGFSNPIYQNEIKDMKLQSDGKVLISGRLFGYEQTSSIIGLGRLNANGTLDNTFNGIYNSVIGNYSDAIAIQSDGKLIASGFFYSFINNPFSPTGTRKIIRIRTSGVLDSSFTPNINSDFGFISSITTTPDQKILIAGDFKLNGRRNVLIRLLDNGNVDSTFISPFLSDTAQGSISSIVLAENGKIMCGGSITGYNNLSTPGVFRILGNNCSIPNQITVAGNLSFCVGSSTQLVSSLLYGNLWSTGDTTRSIIVTTPGNFSVRKMTNGCTTSFSGILSVNLNLTPAPSTATITGDTAFCQGSFSRLTSSSPTGNLWSTGDTTQFINVAQAGSYTVRVINGGCSSAVSAQFRVVDQGPSPTVINFDTTSNRCLGARLQLTPAGTFAHYYWNTGERTRSIYTRLSGQYSVQVANSDSCFGLPSPPIFIAFDTNWCSVEIFRVGLDSITANVWADSYIWYLDGIELLSSNTLKTIPIQGVGVYTFRAVTAGRTSPLSNPIVITSVRKSLGTKFEVYPNPATNKVTVNTSGTGTLEILNTLGQVVITQPATATNELNLSLLAKGVYTVRFNGASKMLVVK